MGAPLTSHPFGAVVVVIAAELDHPTGTGGAYGQIEIICEGAFHQRLPVVHLLLVSPRPLLGPPLAEFFEMDRFQFGDMNVDPIFERHFLRIGDLPFRVVLAGNRGVDRLQDLQPHQPAFGVAGDFLAEGTEVVELGVEIAVFADLILVIARHRADGPARALPQVRMGR